MGLPERFLESIETHQLFRREDPLLLAVSGGVDSVVLCRLCQLAGFRFRIAHANFQLRGEESTRDEAFVVGLGASLGVDVLLKRFDTNEYATAHGCTIQVAARELRYEWLFRIPTDDNATSATATSFPYILTAHHQDDNVETILMNFFKGTGIAGLRGILPKQGRLVRPLLPFAKEELLIFAREQQLQWVEDSSNVTTKYTRNYLRHEVIPVVEKVFPQALHNLANAIPRMRETEMLYREAIGGYRRRLVEQKGNEYHIPVRKLQLVQPLTTVVFELMREFGFSTAQTGEIIRLLDSPSGKYVQSATHRVIRNRAWMIIAPLDTSGADTVLVEEPVTGLPIPIGKFSAELVSGDSFSIPVDPQTALVDARDIAFPLLLRKWKQGDYFYPLGMKKKKKLGRFLIDLKLSRTEKEKVWVVEMNKKIIWVIGYRIDDRFRITDRTKTAFRMRLEPR